MSLEAASRGPFSPTTADAEVLELRTTVRELRSRVAGLEMTREEMRWEMQQLTETRDHYTELYDFAPVGYLTLDSHGTILDANLCATTMLGAERDQLVDQHTLGDFISLNDQETWCHQKDAMLKNRGKHTCELAMLKKGNAAFTARLECFHMTSVTDGAERHMIVMIDITEEKRIERRLSYLSRFPSESPHPVLRIQADGIVRYANDAAKRLLESWEISAGKPAPILWTMRVVEALGKNAPLEYQTTVDEEVFSFCVAPVPGAGYANLYGTDVTKRVRAEERLLRQEQELAKLVTERTAALSESGETLAEAQHIAHLGNWDWNIKLNKLRWSDEVFRILGQDPEKTTASYDTILDCVHPDDLEQVKSAVNRALYENRPYNCDHRVMLPTGDVRIVHGQAEVFCDKSGEPVRMVGTIQDVTEIRESKRRLNAVNDLLRLFVVTSSRTEYMDAVASLIHKLSGCQCVGLKVLNDTAALPYESAVGFSRDFRDENCWVAEGDSNCVCASVFNSQSRSSAQRETDVEISTCGKCVRHGLASVAVIPIRYRNQVLGVIHMAEEKDTRVAGELIDFIREITILIGEALHRFNTEEALLQNYSVQNVINSLLRLPEENLPFHGILDEALGMILSFHSSSFERRGSIFMIEEGSDAMTMMTQRGVPDCDLETCSNIVVGHDLCWQAALTGEVQFSDSLDVRHASHHNDTGPHGHYYIPIKADGRTLGVLSILLPDGYKRSIKEDNSLTAMANTLGGVISRHNADHLVVTQRDQLRALSSELSLAEEKERKRLATALHDSVGQTLALSKLKLGSLGRLLTSDEGQSQLKEISDIFEQSIQQLRSLTFELSPPILYELGLPAAIEWLGEQFERQQQDVVFHFDWNGESFVTDEMTSVLLFQSTRELLANVGKHAKADRVTVLLSFCGGSLDVVVHDNGVGFDTAFSTAKAHEQQSFGLFSIRERMSHIGGELRIDSRLGEATTVTLSAPISGKPGNTESSGGLIRV